MKKNPQSEKSGNRNRNSESKKVDAGEKLGKVEVFSTGFSKGFSQAITLNAYPNGISVTIHKPWQESLARATNSPVLQSESRGLIDPFFPRTRETRDVHVPEGKFLVYRDNIKQNLEKIFYSLAKKKQLSDTIVYLGTFTDPFHGFHRKFSQTMALIETLERYQPGRLVIQSRSRMLLTALPTLKSMSETAFCVIPFESRLEGSILRYTPGQPRLEERLITAAGLRAQDIEVTFSVSPILPYGDTSGDAWKFAEVLISYSDRVLFQPLYAGEKHEETSLRQLQIAKKLENDNHLKVLRPNAEEEVKGVIKKLSPVHLELPEYVRKDPDQLALFAA